MKTRSLSPSWSSLWVVTAAGCWGNKLQLSGCNNWPALAHDTASVIQWVHLVAGNAIHRVDFQYSQLCEEEFGAHVTQVQHFSVTMSLSFYKINVPNTPNWQPTRQQSIFSFPFKSFFRWAAFVQKKKKSFGRALVSCNQSMLPGLDWSFGQLPTEQHTVTPFGFDEAGDFCGCQLPPLGECWSSDKSLSSQVKTYCPPFSFS